MTPAAAFEAALARQFRGDPPARLGLAVSGGGDSIALMFLARDWARETGTGLRVATVDHGLRPESADEARAVARRAAELALPHDTLAWEGWEGGGNLPAAAREARKSLLSRWAEAHGLEGVLLGHQLDDQAETVLLRLARGSGVDGLAAMSEGRRGDAFLRPLLAVSRADLRAELDRRGENWIEDPTNDDLSFDRPKARVLLAKLGAIGVTADRLAATATPRAEARRVLTAAAADAAERLAAMDLCDIVIDASGLAALPADTRDRLVAAALMYVGGEYYRPRNESLKRAVADALAGRRAVLHGAEIDPSRDSLRIRREAARQQEPVPAGEVWDGLWRYSADGGTLGALGDEGLRVLRRTHPEAVGGHAARSLRVLPAVRSPEGDLGVPHLGIGPRRKLARAAGPADFVLWLRTY